MKSKKIAPKHIQQSLTFKVGVEIKKKMNKPIFLKIRNNNNFKNHLKTFHIIN
jgi:hypothetical protein